MIISCRILSILPHHNSFGILRRGLLRTSLLVQWIRIRLPMQATQVQSLVQEDSICNGAMKPVSHNYEAHVP